ncbi:MAG TPA: phosphoglycerate dehydrogenase [Gemmatimonadales bacterium]|jgi:D-3-phosphoglycerate dehydrogenase|nr:phosphoglycerate dehydrogenase [Gemmatimonadales bacterium]
MTWRVVVADRVAGAGLKVLSETTGVEVVNVAGQGREALERALSGAHALVVRSETRVTAELMNRAPQLRVVARAGTGVDTIDVPAATRRGIAVMNTPGANTVSAAEHAMGLLLGLARHIPWAAEAMRRGEWDRKRFEGTELRGKTMGVIGLGRIGAHVAQIARAFGMTVVAHDPFLPAERAAALQIRLLPLEQLLRAADVVTLHVALTDDTRHLINAERLRLMKPTAFLVNTARGELVDEPALAEAVRDKRIAGAAVDVFAVEPLPADSPLRQLDRVILTPHLAASTAEAQERVAHEICVAVRDAIVEGDYSSAINVPGIAGDVLRRLAPLLDLARRLGRLGTALADGAPTAVEVAYGGKDEPAPKPVTIAAVEGLLAGVNGGAPVSLVNALLLAQERGIQVGHKVGAAEPGFEATVGVRVDTARGRTRVMGALAAGRDGRVIRIDEFPVDVVPEGWMLVIRNRDVPGVIGRVGTVLGEAGVNIGSYHQARRAGGGEALAAIAVDQRVGEPVLSRLAALPDVLQVHLADLGG